MYHPILENFSRYRIQFLFILLFMWPSFATANDNHPLIELKDLELANDYLTQSGSFYYGDEP